MITGRTYTMYAQRSEWADVTPVEQDTDPRSVIQIAYTERYTDCMNYLRAVLCSNEVSLRCLELTRDCLELNAANYSVWHYRRQLLSKLGADIEQRDGKEARLQELKKEMDFVENMIEESPKNYQVWHHRRWLLQELGDASGELAFTLEIFDDDAKNYHAWEHRQWVVRNFNLWEGEEEVCRRLIEFDRRNNSAWNHLYFILTHGAVGTAAARQMLTDDVVKKCTSFVYTSVEVDPDNESAWNFLRGIYAGKKLFEEEKLWELTEMLMTRSDSSRVVSPFVYSFHVDMLTSRLETSTGTEEERSKDLLKATGLLLTLAEELDPIRRRYWNYLRRKLLIRYGRKVNADGEKKDSVADLEIDAGTTSSSQSNSDS